MTAIYNLLSVTCYLKLATTCKNLFLSLVVVRLVIFYISFDEAFYLFHDLSFDLINFC